MCTIYTISVTVTLIWTSGDATVVPAVGIFAFTLPVVTESVERTIVRARLLFARSSHKSKVALTT